MKKFIRVSSLLVLMTLVVSPLCVARESIPTTSMAKEEPGNKVSVNIVYYAEDTCVVFKKVREGHPESIEAPKKSLVVTVVVGREKMACEQKLKVINHKITIADKPEMRAVEIFYVSEEGKFIRSSKPRIYRKDDLDDSLTAL